MSGCEICGKPCGNGVEGFLCYPRGRFCGAGHWYEFMRRARLGKPRIEMNSERLDAIVSGIESGKSFAQMGKMFGISRHRCRKIYTKARARAHQN